MTDNNPAQPDAAEHSEAPDTIRIRARLNIVGHGLALQTGDIADLPAAQAMRLLERGYATPAPAAEIETR
jgi:hypothetical protein